MVGFIGFLCLIVFGGIGFVTLPLSLIKFFVNRPKPITLQQYARGQLLLNKWANELISQGNEIREDGNANGFNGRKIKKQLVKYEQQLEYLEKAYETIEVSYKIRGGNPITPWLSVFAGILGIIITIIWIAHIAVYYVFDIHPFLNQFLYKLDSLFPFAAITAFGLLVYYLYWCVVHGTVTFGVNILIVKIHGMEVGNTPMTSILFNSIILLFASFGVALFSTMNFPIYTRLTSLEMIYGTQVKTLKGLKYVWQYGTFVMLGFLVLSLLIKVFTINNEKENRIANIQEILSKHDTKITE